jgi:exodeoxyribonuclease VII small subunit
MVRELQKPITQMSFEEAMLELEKIVKNIETGNTSLEDSISEYELGNALKNHCEKKLKESQMRVEKIIKKENGEIAYDNFDKI